MSDQRCEHCGGVGRVGLPRGMSPGFYAFLGAGCRYEDEGAEMVCPRCDGKAPPRKGPPSEERP